MADADSTATLLDSETSLGSLLRLPPGAVDLTEHDPRATPGYPGKGKADAEDERLAMADELSDLQERLFAAGRVDPEGAPRVLLVLQGMDTSGKGGTIRSAIGLVDPQGVTIRGFGPPTAEERSHDFLWRIRRAVPAPGRIGVFDRSHYEDVLVARVDSLVPDSTWRSRYDAINRFEAELVAEGTHVVKCFLHISPEKQAERLAARLDDPTKHWKYNPSDLDSRSKWPAYQQAYEDALERCATQDAPWYVVPADRKWYRNWAVARLLLETLRSLDLSWPVADFDPDEQRALLAQTAIGAESSSANSISDIAATE